MRNLKLLIEYDGTSYCGWQIQTRTKKKSIQDTIEKALQRILQEKIKLIASGRTDAGVHAFSQVANFKTKSRIPLEKLQRGLNSLLPRDIVVKNIAEVRLDFHSRFCAKSKLYRYTILNRPYPCALGRNYAHFVPRALDIKSMQKQSIYLLGKHTFKSFQAADKIERDPVRTINSVNITRCKDYVHIDIEADGFLYNMARNIAGTLIGIGLGKPFNIKEILKGKDRSLAGPTAPAKGLCLMEITY